jgi:hypothetical protein
VELCGAAVAVLLEAVVITIVVSIIVVIKGIIIDVIINFVIIVVAIIVVAISITNCQCLPEHPQGNLVDLPRRKEPHNPRGFLFLSLFNGASRSGS